MIVGAPLGIWTSARCGSGVKTDEMALASRCCLVDELVDEGSEDLRPGELLHELAVAEAVDTWLTLRSRGVDHVVMLLHQPVAVVEHVLYITVCEVDLLLHLGDDFVIHESLHCFLNLLDLLLG